MYYEIQSRPVQADPSFRLADATGAETAGQKVSRPPSALPGALRFETVRNGFSWPISPARTSLPRAGRFTTGALWRRQSQISWKWISAALVSV